ncbi:hypothetical protein LB526_02000 [Mesorhizobium sp. CA6]|uniref:phosphoribosyltransferase-like protein n=1 Tax=Mesorhizobium sp. CA6 TaxID=588500 RepID=UPI001CCAEAD7|nr:hypothetical protein [Mesorhizobium sp. CA6]MBZ9765532.1 hypothetical protein [Mesorhizobium sp. CA6]
MSLSQTDFVRDWLAQFSEPERPVAAQLADAVMLVSHDAFYRGLRLLLDETTTNRDEGDQDRPIALFAERAVETRDTKDSDNGFVRHEVLPFFPGTDEGRATGAGMPPIVVDPSDQEVGSEGAIANFITGYERLHRDRVLSHPGPDALRTRRVGHIVIVADFIGSGKRVWEMLEAFWRVATIRSWHSYGLVSFAVVAYSGTEDGLKHVRSHRSVPNVRVVHACPTIFTTFVGAERDAVEALCRAHPHKSRYPFGFGWAGALIAFSHGMPNNAPPVLHSDRKGWVPLFRNRSALGADMHFPAANADALAERARAVLQIRTAERFLADPTRRRWVETMLVLTALKEGSRTAASASARTRLSFADVEQILVFTRIAGWTSLRNTLTVLGQRELRRLQLRRARTVVLPTEDLPYYYPSQLRAR